MAKYETYARLRDAKGYNDYKMSKETGIGTATFSDWKHNRTTPKVDKLIAIAKVLGIEVTQLLEV